jgi:Ca2+-binding EF-hand superfamily protein
VVGGLADSESCASQWFDAIDRDRDGHLAPKELQSALQLGGLNFSLATVAHIIR